MNEQCIKKGKTVFIRTTYTYNPTKNLVIGTSKNMIFKRKNNNHMSMIATIRSISSKRLKHTYMMISQNHITSTANEIMSSSSINKKLSLSLRASLFSFTNLSHPDENLGFELEQTTPTFHFRPFILRMTFLTCFHSCFSGAMKCGIYCPNNRVKYVK